MKPNEILELVRAGYTKEEIDSMTPAREVEVEVEVEKEVEVEVEKEETPEVETPELSGVTKGYIEEMNKVFNGMIDTLKSIQTANINNSTMPSTPDYKPEDILGKIIAPENFRAE